jgi:DNA polymerase-3 subunit gamma/tau
MLADAPPAERWRAAVDEVEKVSPLAAPVLKQATLLALGDGLISIQLPPGIMAATAEKRRPEIEAVFARFFGRPTRLEVTVGAAASGAGSSAPPGAAAPSIAASEAAERNARAARVREAARNHPNIREAARVLDGGIDKIEEL